MKVRHLISKLEKLDPESHIVTRRVSDNEYYYYGDVLLTPLSDIEVKPAYMLCENMDKVPLDFVEEKPKFFPNRQPTNVVILNF